MAKQLGRSVLLKIGDGVSPTEGFTVVATLNTKTLTLANTAIDATTPDATTPEGKLWRESLTGMRMVDISGDGITDDQAQIKRLVAIWNLDDPVANFQMDVKGVGAIQGAASTDGAPFRMTSLEFGGETEGTSTFSIALESNGEVNFVAESG